MSACLDCEQRDPSSWQLILSGHGEPGGFELGGSTLGGLDLLDPSRAGRFGISKPAEPLPPTKWAPKGPCYTIIGSPGRGNDTSPLWVPSASLPCGLVGVSLDSTPSVPAGIEGVTGSPLGSEDRAENRLYEKKGV